MYRIVASISAAIVLASCAATGGRPPTADSSVPSTITPIVAVASTEPVRGTSPATTVVLATTTTTNVLAQSAATSTPAAVAEAPRAAQPVPPLPADLVSQPSALPSDPVVIPSDEPPVDAAAPSDETVAIGWVVEMTTYRADEPIQDRRARLVGYTDAVSLTNGPPPFDLTASAPEAMWPTGATVSSAVGGIVVVEVSLKQTPESGARAAPALVTVEVTIADGRVVGWKVLP